MTGILTLAGTPIGDSKYAAPVLCSALEQAELIAAEDTRRLRTLLLRLGVETKAEVHSYFEGNEEVRTGWLVEQLLAGRDVLLVTDAGMPSVSDPGYRLTRAAIDAGIRVSCLPGPSAVLAALAVSGLSVDRFCFEGFLGRKTGERERQLSQLRTEERTMVFFEAPHRLAEFLSSATKIIGAERKAAICRELTKPHEEVIRGTLAKLTQWAEGEVRGEITVVIAGAENPGYSLEDALELVTARTATGEKLSSAVAEVAEITEVRRKDLYTAALKR